MRFLTWHLEIVNYFHWPCTILWLMDSTAHSHAITPSWFPLWCIHAYIMIYMTWHSSTNLCHSIIWALSHSSQLATFLFPFKFAWGLFSSSSLQSLRLPWNLLNTCDMRAFSDSHECGSTTESRLLGEAKTTHTTKRKTGDKQETPNYKNTINNSERERHIWYEGRFFIFLWNFRLLTQ